MTSDNGRFDATPSAEAPREDREVGLADTESDVVVVPDNGDWRVATADGSPLGSFATKSQACTAAREAARDAKTSVSVRRADGTFQETFTPRGDGA